MKSWERASFGNGGAPPTGPGVSSWFISSSSERAVDAARAFAASASFHAAASASEMVLKANKSVKSEGSRGRASRSSSSDDEARAVVASSLHLASASEADGERPALAHAREDGAGARGGAGASLAASKRASSVGSSEVSRRPSASGRGRVFARVDADPRVPRPRDRDASDRVRAPSRVTERGALERCARGAKNVHAEKHDRDDLRRPRRPSGRLF